MKKMYTQFLVLIAFVVSSVSTAQTQALYRVSEEEKMAKSSLVVEGEVIAQTPFWNAAHNFVFTCNTLRVYKVFKGQLSQQTVEIVTLGGTIDGFSVATSHLLTLRNHEAGVFYCINSPMKVQSPTTGKPLHEVYAGQQGFLKYDPITGKADAPFAHYQQITTQLYPRLQLLAGQSFQTVGIQKTWGAIGKPVAFGSPAPTPSALPIISSFTPDTVVAGATENTLLNTITINGSGFGTNTGLASVWFDDTYDGKGGARWYVDRNDPLLISWSDTKIVVKVPTSAGTGKILVENANGVFDTSATDLQVAYAVQSSTYNNGTITVTKELNLMNHNGSGGYTFVLSNSTAGSIPSFDNVAGATFSRALDTWKKKVGYNAIIGNPTSLQSVSGDDINVVMFDNPNTGLSPLPAGTLATTYFYSTICAPIATNGYKRVGFDMVVHTEGFSGGASIFNFGPCPSSGSNSDYDLESTLLHEIGHSIGLAHLNEAQEGATLPNINPGPVMSAGIDGGVRRTSLDYSALIGGKYLVAPSSNTYGSCFGSASTEMTPLTNTITISNDDCPLSFPAATTPIGTTVFFDLANATSNTTKDPQSTAVDCSGNIAPVTNTAYYAVQTNSAGSLNLSVSGYATTPASLATCTKQGVSISLYPVNSCPKGQAFPTPIACRSFSGNGSIAAITGLAAKTKYLLMANGVANTKASFNLTFNGTALPVKLESFTGTALQGRHILQWGIAANPNIGSIELEKSTDGIRFSSLQRYDATLQYLRYTQTDANPYSGANYYRLVITEKEGQKTYSNLVVLTNKDRINVAVYPNPVKGNAQIQVTATEPLKNVEVALFNAIGQRIASFSTSIEPGYQVRNLPTATLPAGTYRLVVTQNGQTIMSSKTIYKQ